MKKGKSINIFFVPVLALIMILFADAKAYGFSIFKRVYGPDRYCTAIDISKLGWSSSDNVVLTTGDEYPDALSASPLSKLLDAPILLVDDDSFNNVKSRILELNAKNVYIIGATGAISQSIEDSLKSSGINVVRICGDDRYKTSLEIAKYISVNFGGVKEIAIATGTNFPDALSIAPIAAIKSMPILLSPGDELSDDEMDFVKTNNIEDGYIIGGPSVIGNDIENSGIIKFERIYGSNRYETNDKVIERFKDNLSFSNIFIATGENFPDALSGSAYASKIFAPVVLSEYNPKLPVYNDLSKCEESIKEITVAGGEEVVTTYALLSMLPVCQELDNIPAIAQKPELPTGCEATAAAMLLNSAGIKVTKQSIANSLPEGRIPYFRNGKLYGGNPSYCFVGNPYLKTGFGVYHGPIFKVVDKYDPGHALDISGTSIEGLFDTISSGHPVVVWATIRMISPVFKDAWYDTRGNKIVWPTYEHALLLTGYNNNSVIFNDPYTGTRDSFSIRTFENIWSRLGRQAVTIK